MTENMLIALSLSDIKLSEDSSEDTGTGRECEVRVVCSGHEKALTVQKKFIMHGTHKLIQSVTRDENRQKGNYRKGSADLISTMSMASAWEAALEPRFVYANTWSDHISLCIRCRVNLTHPVVGGHKIVPLWCSLLLRLCLKWFGKLRYLFTLTAGTPLTASFIGPDVAKKSINWMVHNSWATHFKYKIYFHFCPDSQEGPASLFLRTEPPHSALTHYFSLT